ncbi:MAG TPA: tyrosine-protein phosphatase [Kineosporiaceae bacterium]|nr:tyrosine-protein phosphatase [Kineosporiaceae bacterium]
MLWIALDGAVNVRDVGGMPTVDGSVTAQKRLLRADNLQGLSEADVSRLVDEFGLTRVIDLRTVAEVTSEGPGPLSAVTSVEHVHHSVIPASGDRHLSRAQAQAGAQNGASDRSTAEMVSEVLLARRGRYASANPDDVVSGHYLGYLEDRPDSVVAALRAIAETPGAALVHCAAGKDRTGVIVALALLAVGVDREAVIADYVATAERIDAILARLRASATYGSGVDEVSTDRHTPRASAMKQFLDLVDSQHGGVAHWLAERGFGAEDIERLRRKLLAG